MTKVMENSRWYKEKRPVVDEYLKTVSKVEGAVAGRGFAYAPGFLAGAMTDIERAAKFKLSDVNFQIAAEAIERELAQTKHDYDIAVKEAMILWELEKTQTLTALDQELAAHKMARAYEMEELDRMQIQIHLRRWVILAAEVAIKEEMEALRQELNEIDRIPFDAQGTLLNAKLITAQKKLDEIG